MANEPQTSAAPKSGLFKTLLFGALAVIAIVGGGFKIWRGLGGLFGWDANPVLTKSLEESDAASAKALEHATAGDAEYNALIDVVNGDSWESLREGEATVKGVAALRQAAETFRVAAKKLEVAMAQDVAERLKEFLKLKHDLYLAYADAYDHKREAVELMADTTIATKDELVAKLNELTEMTDASLTAANEMGVKADAIAKELAAK